METYIYYDPEYQKEVDEDYIRSQYEWFTQFSWFTKSYEQFRDENFERIMWETEI